MPRANRHFVPDLVWHITHRCHERDFLLKFSRDRNSYLRWLYEARKRFGLCVLDYMVTSNHVHLLVKDTAEGVIARSMQLIAGRAAQDYNRRKARVGAFWEDRYHATAIESGAHLHRCVVYIDLNMVRAGSEGFVEQVKIVLGFRAQHRQVAVADGLYTPTPTFLPVERRGSAKRNQDGITQGIICRLWRR
jgi:REP element-mobilizing transposase RayT